MASSSTGAFFPSGSWPQHPPNCIFKKLESQKLPTQMKQAVCNVCAQVRVTQPGLPVVCAFRSVSQLAGVSECTVARLKSEVLSRLKPPKRKTASFGDWKTTRIAE